MAVFPVNCTVVPKGSCRVPPVFAEISRLARTIPSPSQLERAKVIDCAMDAISKEQAQRKIAYGLKHTNRNRV